MKLNYFLPRSKGWALFNKALIITCVFVFKNLLIQANVGIDKVMVSDTFIVEAFPLSTNNQNATLWYDIKEYSGVIRAIGDLQLDIERVTGKKPEIYNQKKPSSFPVIIGTLGKSVMIDKLVKSKKININDIEGKWESFVIATIDNPIKGIERALVIAGSDKRGTIYGIYELSKQLGVSPWYWWADVPVKKKEEVYIKNGYYASGEPKVKYRGIFINDEMPCMSSWAKEKFGGMNSEMYAHVFELLLRLKANCLWPGMWGSMKEYEPLIPILRDENGNYLGHSFNEDDPQNPVLANEYGIVMGTSHHEPMQRSQQEWLRNKTKYGNGEWNYLTNKDGIQKFFREGIENNKNLESLITMGMRGDEDRPMEDAGSAQENFRLLERIMKDQRLIIEEVTGKPASETPQVWTLYKEVLDYYDKGMNVPDDMIIVLCDDNWGDIRRIPEPGRDKHPGGYGMYYHAGYYGAPRANKWLNMNQIQHMWEQLQFTYDYGIDKLWVLNVGDIKPLEFPMDFFLEMAWNPELFNEKYLFKYTQTFCEEQFGKKNAWEVAFLLNQYCKYSSRITAEMLNEKTYNLSNGEFKMVKDEFLALEARSLRQFLGLSDEYKDAYKELVLFPIQAMANLYDMYFAIAMNRKLAKERDTMANFWGRHVEYCFNRDIELCSDYNLNIASGKWNHMMDQVHIGYSDWHAPQFNIMPEVKYVAMEDAIQGRYVYSEKNGVVVMEAEHYYEFKNSDESTWSVIPDLGRTLSGLTLMPYNKNADGAWVKYKLKLKEKHDSVNIRMVFDCTLPFINGGHQVKVGFQEGKEKLININNHLNWDNKYTYTYPTAAQRIIETDLVLTLPEDKNGTYTFVIHPLDPGVVIHKVIVDCGGFEKTHLNLQESPYIKD